MQNIVHLNFFVNLLFFIYLLARLGFNKNFSLLLTLTFLILVINCVAQYFLLNKNKHNIETNSKEKELKNTYIAGIMHDLKNPLIGQIRILESLIKKNNENTTTIELYKQLTESNFKSKHTKLNINNAIKFLEQQGYKVS